MLLQDLNSGLVGPLIVCRKNTKASIVHRVLHFMIFNENKSWYFEENVNTYSSDPNNIDRNDELFDLSNQMHGNVHQLTQQLAPVGCFTQREQRKVHACHTQQLTEGNRMGL